LHLHRQRRHRLHVKGALLAHTRFNYQCLIKELLQFVVHHLLLLHLEQLTPEEVPVGSILPQRILIGNGVAALLNEKLNFSWLNRTSLARMSCAFTRYLITCQRDSIELNSGE
jgi:hypothetical protein